MLIRELVGLKLWLFGGEGVDVRGTVCSFDKDSSIDREGAVEMGCGGFGDGIRGWPCYG